MIKRETPVLVMAVVGPGEDPSVYSIGASHGDATQMSVETHGGVRRG